ncbi:MAG: pirin family protein [Pelovirga sp.]
MSNLIDKEMHCKKLSEQARAAVRLLLEPEQKDLGGFTVRRLLPTAEVRSVGPFIFFDHVGPATFPPGKGIDIRPHPHIGLATITYVFEGEILHRDSLGSVQHIRTNEINWMTAGRGISHSERTPPDLRRKEHRLHGLQLWVALPGEDEQTEPFFAHYDSGALPLLEAEGVRIRVMVGRAYGLVSQVKTHSPTLYVEISLAAGKSVAVPDQVEECAIYMVSGCLRVGAGLVPEHTMAILDQTRPIELVAQEACRLVIIGGSPLGKRTMWWNLVATRKDLLEQAKQAWRDRSFPQVPEETDYIPLPE